MSNGRSQAAMENEKQAVVEGILERIWKEEWQDLDLILSRTGDVQFWADVMRYEIDLETLTRDLLQSDKTLEGLRDFNVQSMSAFHYAGLRGAATVLRRALQVGLSVEVSLRNGSTVLHLASFAGRLETVALMVDEFQANVNREDGHRCRPLHYASAQGHQHVVEFLVSRGADIGARDTEGTTAAYHARKHRNQPIVSYLLDISGDGDVLLVEEKSLTNETHTAPKRASALYARVCKKNKKKQPALDYEEVSTSFSGDSGVETVKGSKDADDENRLRTTDERKDTKKCENRMAQGISEFPLASSSRFETESDHASVSEARHNNGAKDTFSCKEEWHIVKAHSEDVGLVSNCATNSTAFSEDAALDRSDESNEVANYKLNLGRRQHCYEEITLPNEPATYPTVSHGYATLEENINMTKGGFGRRNHVYEEIELPTDTMSHSEIGSLSGNTFSASNVMANSSRRNHQYEELNISSDSADPNSNILNERSATEEEIIPIIDISNFVRRPHQYEELQLPPDEDPNKIHLDENRVEQEVRQLLRKEMRQLERMVKAVDVNNSSLDSHKDFNSSVAITGSLNVSEIAEVAVPDRHYDTAAVITLGQLQCLVREEFQRFADQLRLTEPLSKLGDQKKEDLNNVLPSTSTCMSPGAGLYEELTICDFDEIGVDIGQTETNLPALSKESNLREDMMDKKEKKPPASPPHSTNPRKPEVAERTTRESKFNFSPLLLRKPRDLLNGKEKGNGGRSPNRSPLRLNAQYDKLREENDPKTEQVVQKSNEVKAGQSQFYVSLAHKKNHSKV